MSSARKAFGGRVSSTEEDEGGEEDGVDVDEDDNPNDEEDDEDDEEDAEEEDEEEMFLKYFSKCSMKGRNLLFRYSHLDIPSFTFCKCSKYLAT